MDLRSLIIVLENSGCVTDVQPAVVDLVVFGRVGDILYLYVMIFIEDYIHAQHLNLHECYILQ